MVMELSEQLEARGSWLKLDWGPRRQNEEADALTNEQFGGFREDLRIHLDPPGSAVDSAHGDPRSGGGMLRELEEKKLQRKASRHAAKEAKKRRKAAKDSLKEREFERRASRSELRDIFRACD